MKKVFLLFCLLAFAGTAFAGFSLGYKPVSIPYYVSVDGNAQFTNVNLLRVGFAASPDFRLEFLAGYDKVNFEWEVGSTSTDANETVYIIGASGFYVIANPANTVFSIGLSFLYGKGTGEDTAGVDIPETSGYGIYPIMRVDFAIPGAERFALFTEFGARYLSTKTDDDGDEYKFNDLSTWGSENILGGAYYSF